MSKLNVLVAGSTGYIGVELIKLLIKHKYVNIKYLCGHSSIGKDISTYDLTLSNSKLPKIVRFNKLFLKNVDVIFSALPNGEAQEISKKLLAKNILIDMSADFRLTSAKSYLKWYKQNHKAPLKIDKSIYSLPEFTGPLIKKYNIISCPGCYPTSILLPLIPLIKKDLINLDNIVIDSKSGFSGAGRGVFKKNKDKDINETISAYGVGFHRHNSELDQEIRKTTKKNFNLIFTPHLTPMFRGILSTIYLTVNKTFSLTRIHKELSNFYKKKKFVKVLKPNTLLSTNDVINTNYCKISVFRSKYKNKFIILSTIDNLIKGGAGQAIQNMNIRFNFNEYEGLK